VAESCAKALEGQNREQQHAATRFHRPNVNPENLDTMPLRTIGMVARCFSSMLVDRKRKPAITDRPRRPYDNDKFKYALAIAMLFPSKELFIAKL
jgi:hypothetical protein